MNRKTLVIPLVALIIGLLIGALIVYATSPSSTLVVESGIYPGAPSYTIWVEGSTYFAKDANGLVVYSGSNATTIANSVSAHNGTIFFKAGTYLIDGGFNLVSNQVITGEGAATIFSVTSTSIETQLFRGWEIENTTISNIKMIGNNNTYVTTGVYFLRTDNCIIQNCIIQDFRNRGISFDGGYGDGIYGMRNKVLNNHVETTYAVVMAESIVLGGQKYAVVSGNTAYNSMHGGITLADCSNSTVVGNIVRDADGQNVGYGGIDFELCNSSIISSNVITGRSRGIRLSGSFNIISNNNIQVAKCGINLLYYGAGQPTTNYNNLLGNMIYSASTQEGIGLSDAYYTQITGCITYRGAYGLIEAAPSNYNTVVSCSFWNGTTSGIKTVGANTHVNLCWNSTTWIS